jgi:hypothetical protein
LGKGDSKGKETWVIKNTTITLINFIHSLTGATV